MSTRALIEELLREVDVAEASIAAQRKAFEARMQEEENGIADMRTTIRTLERREQLQNPKPVPLHTAMQLKMDAEPDTGEPGATFTARVSEATDVLAAQGSSIDNGTVFGLLRHRGEPMPNNPRIKIGTILRRLEERGYLRRVADASGNESAKYEKVSKEESAA